MPRPFALNPFHRRILDVMTVGVPIERDELRALADLKLPEFVVYLEQLKREGLVTMTLDDDGAQRWYMRHETPQRETTIVREE